MTAYRANSFAFIHLNLFHTLMNLLALTPLMERFEGEYGTLTALALFLGRTYAAQVSRYARREIMED